MSRNGPKPRVLYHALEIRAAIKQILAKGTGRRVVMAAYVGAGAKRYLPRPDGIELICWDQDGATDADEIRALRKAKVKVWFSRNLHMKLYWAEGLGAVIGSANLSANGLDIGGLHELAVLVPPEMVDIERLIRMTNSSPVTPAALRSLDKRTRIYRSRNEGKGILPEGRRLRATKRTFAEWYESPDRADWRLFSYCEYFEGLTNDVRDTLKSQGHSKPYYYWMGTPKHTQPHEWCLDVDTNRNSLGVYWIIADFFHPVRSSEVEFYDKRWPNFAVQIYPTRVYGPPPFNEKELAFKRAIRKLLKEAGAVTYMQGLKFAPGGRMSQKQLASLYERYLAERSKK